MGLEVGEPFGLVARFSMSNACYRLGTPFVELHHLAETPLEGCRDMFMHDGSLPLLALFVMMFSPIHLSFPMFLLYIHNLYFPSS